MKKSLFVAAVAAISLVACKKTETTETVVADSVTVVNDSAAVAADSAAAVATEAAAVADSAAATTK
ncbi:hypothetical protein [Bergeyella sp. RCAD1439]|uniref:hypothetical protein n=1 Tax=Bergeyella anatis TaxID=3113737 RepID=UPI002E1865C3|nr:hypothetical protein [Bergeyella sp. RCAD1439]